MYQKKDVEVLLLDDEIDEIIISSVPKYDEKDLKSVNRSGAADDFSKESDKDVEKSPHNIDDLLAKIGKLEKAAESDAEEIDMLIMKLKKILETNND